MDNYRWQEFVGYKNQFCLLKKAPWIKISVLGERGRGILPSIKIKKWRNSFLFFLKIVAKNYFPVNKHCKLM